MINVSAVIQVAILYAVIYAILKAAKGSRFGQVLTGVGLVAAAMFLFTYVFHFDAQCGRAVDLITGEDHDFGAGSEVGPNSTHYWLCER